MADEQQPQCRSLVKFFLHREGLSEEAVYVRCRKGEDHTGKYHSGLGKTWTDDNEDGWIEEEYDEEPVAG